MRKLLVALLLLALACPVLAAGPPVNVKNPLSIKGYFDVNFVSADNIVGQNTGTDLDDTKENKDIDCYFIDLGYKSKSFTINGFYWQQKDEQENGVDNFKDEPTLAGVTARATLAGIKFKGELATFGGDNGNGTDYVGTQLMVAGTKKKSLKL